MKDILIFFIKEVFSMLIFGVVLYITINLSTIVKWLIDTFGPVVFTLLVTSILIIVTYLLIASKRKRR